jgi:hypothetical protein
MSNQGFSIDLILLKDDGVPDDLCCEIKSDIRRGVRQALVEWNPIDVPEEVVDTEYDDYVSGFTNLILKGKEDAIPSYAVHILANEMELSFSHRYEQGVIELCRKLNHLEDQRLDHLVRCLKCPLASEIGSGTGKSYGHITAASHELRKQSLKQGTKHPKVGEPIQYGNYSDYGFQLSTQVGKLLSLTRDFDLEDSRTPNGLHGPEGAKISARRAALLAMMGGEILGWVAMMIQLEFDGFLASTRDQLVSEEKPRPIQEITEALDEWLFQHSRVIVPLLNGWKERHKDLPPGPMEALSTICRKMFEPGVDVDFDTLLLRSCLKASAMRNLVLSGLSETKGEEK